MMNGARAQTHGAVRHAGPERFPGARGQGLNAAGLGAPMKRESQLVRLLLVFLSCLWLAACGNVQVKPDQPIGTATLKPTVEDKRAGLVGIAPGFAPKTYRRISGGPFGVTEKDISGDDDKQFAQVMPVYLQAQLVEQLRAAGLFEQVTTPEDGATVAEGGKALKLLGTITELSGGSRGLRFWIGFGAGRSKVQIETRLVDAESGAVLLVTADRRIGVMSEAMSLDYGGSSRDLLEQTLGDIARDFVRFLTRLALGQGPSPE